MQLGVILIVVWMALEFVVVIAMIRWGFENGQWKDIEEPKYRMLIDHELQPWPGREEKQSGKQQSQEIVTNVEHGDQT